MTNMHDLGPAALLQELADELDDAFLVVLESGELTALNAAGRDAVARVTAAAKVELVARAQASVTFTWEIGAGLRYSVKRLPSVAQLTVLRLTRQPDDQQLRHTYADFLHVVSHDLRSPLTTIGLAASALASGDPGVLTAKQQDYLGMISSAAEYMSRLVENIQAAGRYDPDTGMYQMDVDTLDLLALVQRAVSDVAIPPDKADQRVHLALSEMIPLIRGDVNMLERAIVNLLDNAVKYTPNGGEIRIALEADGSHVTLTVADSGPGIPMEDRERVFERYVRLKREETRRVRGSGLGLFIVRSVAERHGGCVLLESEVGRGSTFRLLLPIDGPTVAADAGRD